MRERRIYSHSGARFCRASQFAAKMPWIDNVFFERFDEGPRKGQLDPRFLEHYPLSPVFNRREAVKWFKELRKLRPELAYGMAEDIVDRWHNVCEARARESASAVEDSSRPPIYVGCHASVPTDFSRRNYSVKLPKKLSKRIKP